MKLQNLQEAKYAHGKTIERVLKFFRMDRMQYGATGEEQPHYVINPDFVAQLNEEYFIHDIVFGDDPEGKYVYVNDSESWSQDSFLKDIEIFKKSKVL